MSYGYFLEQMKREVAEAQRRGKPSAQERADAWLKQHTPELVGNSVAHGLVLGRLGHPSLTAINVRLATALRLGGVE